MLLTIRLKPGKTVKDIGCGFAEAAMINGVVIEDSTVSEVIRYSKPVQYLFSENGIVVELTSWKHLPFKVLERIWPILNRR